MGILCGGRAPFPLQRRCRSWLQPLPPPPQINSGHASPVCRSVFPYAYVQHRRFGVSRFPRLCFLGRIEECDLVVPFRLILFYKPEHDVPLNAHLGEGWGGLGGVGGGEGGGSALGPSPACASPLVTSVKRGQRKPERFGGRRLGGIGLSPDFVMTGPSGRKKPFL